MILTEEFRDALIIWLGGSLALYGLIRIFMKLHELYENWKYKDK